MRILDIRFDKFDFDDFLNQVLVDLRGNKKRTIALSNPEFLVESSKNLELFHYLNFVDYNVPDGVGILWSSRFLYYSPLTCRITGTDFLPALVRRGKDLNLSYFFLGAKPGIAQMAAQNLKRLYGSDSVIYCRDGYFADDSEKEIIDFINSVSPDVLMVCLGNPRQEDFIHRNFEKLNAKLIFGNGGALDFWANEVKRAPVWMQNLGFEWLFRLFQDPSWKRFKRQFKLIQFPVLVFLQFARQGFRRI